MLAYAFLYAISVIVVKKTLKKVSPLFLFWIIVVLSMPFLTVSFLISEKSSLNRGFWFYALLSVIAYIISYLLGFGILKKSAVSDIYPLMSLRPLFTLILSFFPPLREVPSIFGLIGVLVIVVGIYVFEVRKNQKNILSPFCRIFKTTTLLFLLSVFLMSATIICDKMAIKSTMPENVSYVIFIENILIICFLAIPVLILEKKVFSQIKNNFKSLFILGNLGGISSLLAFFSIPLTNASYVSAFENLNGIFIVIFSVVFLKERRNLFYKSLGSVIMSIGAVIIGLYG